MTDHRKAESQNGLAGGIVRESPRSYTDVTAPSRPTGWEQERSIGLWIGQRRETVFASKQDWFKTNTSSMNIRKYNVVV